MIPQLTESVEPKGDKVVLFPIDPETKTKSGVVIPETVGKDSPQRAIVMALGTGSMGKDCVNPSDHYAVGDTVLIPRYQERIKMKDMDGKEVLICILPVSVILGKVTPNA